MQPCQLDGGLADHAAGAEHEHGLAGCQLAAPGERHERGHGGQPERGERRRVDVGQRHEVGGRHGDTSAMLPSPGAIPADVGNHTGRPSTIPTPCTPGT